MATRGPAKMVSDEEIVGAVKAVTDRPVAVTSDIKSKVDLSTTRIRQRAATLDEEGELRRARLTSGEWIYWVED